MALTKVKLIADGTIVQSHLNASHGITTADIGEGSNLYYTDARARAAVSVSGNALSYNSSTGVITSNFEESPVFTGTVKGSTYLVNGTSVAGIGTSLGDINGAELGPGYLIVSRDDTASAKQISFYKNNVEHSYLETTSSGLNIGGTNVGIGTISPTSKLDIAWGGYQTSGYALTFGADIGNLSTRTNNTTKYGIITGVPYTTTNPNIELFTYYSNNTSNALGIGGQGNTDLDGVNSIAFLTAPNQTSPGQIRMTIDSSGNVGISNTSPSSYHANAKNLVVGNSGNSGISIVGGTNGRSSLHFADGTSGGDESRGYVIYRHTQNDMLIGTDDATAITIDNDQRVGIGTSSIGAGYKLQVKRDTNVNIGFGLQNSGASLEAVNDAINANIPLSLYGSKILLLNGNVGIGNTSPNATLEIGTPGGAFAGSPGSVDRLFIAPYSNTGGPYKFIGRTVSGSSDFLDMYYGSNHIISYGLDGKIGIGTTSPSKLLTVGSATSSSGIFNDGIFVNINGGAAITTKSGTSGVEVQMNAEGSIGTIGTFSNHDLSVRTNNGEKMRIKSGGNILMGITTEQNAGKVQIQSGGSENGGILDIVGSGWYRYYTRVCHNATSAQQAGYWHIKTNIAANSNTMFLAKFYGYIYGSAQILDLTHVGYAYSATSSVINQGTTNNGSDPNASSAIYISANGSKVTFRIAFGSGSNFSTYFAGVFMDIAFPSPAGQGHDFEIEAQSFSTSTSVY